MRCLVRVFAILLVLSGSIGVIQAKPSARECLKHGDIQVGRNNLIKAIRHYTRAIELDPSLAEAYVRRGMARRAKGSLSGAIQDFEKAEQIDPQAILNNRHVAGAYSNRGFIEMGDLQVDDAIVDFTKAIKSYGDAKHYYRRGQARLIDEDLPGAIEDYNQALRFESGNSFLSTMIHAHRGYALLLQGKKKDAQSDFDKCLKPNSGQKVLIELHLGTIETQIKEMRRRRAEARRNLS